MATKSNMLLVLMNSKKELLLVKERSGIWTFPQGDWSAYDSVEDFLRKNFYDLYFNIYPKNRKLYGFVGIPHINSKCVYVIKNVERIIGGSSPRNDSDFLVSLWTRNVTNYIQNPSWIISKLLVKLENDGIISLAKR